VKSNKQPLPSSIEKQALLQRISDSQLLANKHVLRKLLTYLFVKTIQELPIQEQDIAKDVFQRSASSSSSDDTIVRVNIHKLRKTLEHYFLDEGADEALVVQIPKGNYVLQFINKNENAKAQDKYSLSFFISFGIIVFLVLSTMYVVFWLKPNSRTHHPIWQTYYNQTLPICITLGDPFFMRAIDQKSQEEFILRDIYVNEAQDIKSASLDRLRGNDFELSPLEYSYFSQNSIWPLVDIISCFAKANKQPKLTPLSRLKADEMKLYNHIVIGNINALGAFANYLDLTSIKIGTHPRTIDIQINGRDSLHFDIEEKLSGYYRDYAFLVKVPGPNHNVITILADFHASGNKGLTHLITDPEQLESLVQYALVKYGVFPEYFEMLVEVQSFNYEDFESKLIFFNEIKK
jgi:hypothetical protein